MTDRRRFRRLVRGMLMVLGFVSLAAAIALFAFTQTSVGRNAVGSMIGRAIGGAVSGEVRIGRVLGGNLLTRVVVERFEIVDADGEVFVALDTVRLEYDPTGFLTDNFRFRRADVARAELRLLEAVDGSWNFQRMFGGDESREPAPEGDGLVLLFNDVTIGSGRFEVRRPWSEEGSADGEGIWRIERGEGGLLEQVLEIRSIRAGFPFLRLADPVRPMHVRIEDMSGLVDAVRRPLDLLALNAELTIADTVAIAIDELRFPESRLAGDGWIAPGTPVQYRFDLTADPIGFPDLQWLPIPLPREGGGPAALVVRSRGETLVVDVDDGDVRVRDTRITGSFSLHLEDPPHFDRLNARFLPLRVRLLDHLLDREELIDGYIDGTIRGSGTLAALGIQADLTLRDLEGDVAPSALLADGGVSLEEPFPLNGLKLSFAGFEPRWTQVLGFSTGLSGRIDGAATLDGVPGGLLTFDANVLYRLADGSASHLLGGGSIDLAEASVIDVSLEVQPLSLAVLRKEFPRLELVGEVRGQIEARGGLADLELRADLDTPRGQMSFNGRFDLESEEQTYDGRVSATGLALDEWVEGAPETDLAVRGRVVGTGTDPATLTATFDLEILPSVFQRVAIDTSRIRFTLGDGMAVVDTLVIDTDVGQLAGRGSFGLSDRQSGALILVADVPDLAQWNRWILDELPGAAQAERGEDLFAGFDEPAAVGPEAEGGRVEGFAGRVFARGVLFGNLVDYQLGGQLEARDVRYKAAKADSLVTRLNFFDPTQPDSLIINGRSWGLQAIGQATDSLTARLARYSEGRAELRLYGVRDTTVELSLETGLEWGDGRFVADLRRMRLVLEGRDAVLAAPSFISYGDSGLVVRSLELRGAAGTVRADGALPAVGSGTLDLSVVGVDLVNVGQLLPEPPAVDGTLETSIHMTGSLGRPLFDGLLRVEGPGYETAEFRRIESRFSYSNRVLSGDLALWDGPRAVLRADGELRADLALRGVERRLAEEAFDFRVSADQFPLGLIELEIESLDEVVGYVSGEVRVRGGPGELRYDGALQVAEAEASIPNLGIRLVGIAGQAEFSGSDARIDSLVATSGTTGVGRVSGRVGLSEFGNPAFDLDVDLNRFRGMDRYAMSFLLSGEGTLGGTYEAPELTGDFAIRDGDIRQDEFMRSRQVIDLTDPDIFSLIDTTIVAEKRLVERFQNPFMRNLRMDVRLDLGPNLWLRADAMDVEMVADGLEVSMDRAQESIVMTGRVEIQRGTYTFDRIPPYNQQLRITGGSIDFVGTPGLNPNVDITAEYRTRTVNGAVTVEAHITGTMRDNELTLSSTPPMSDSDQLCFVAVGSPCFGAGDSRLGERLVQQSVLGAFSSGLSSAFVGSSGLSYLNLRSTGTLYGGDLVGVANQGLFARTEIEIGWYGGENVFFMVAQPLGGGVPRAAVEWRFSENWTLEARAENRFDQQQYGLYRGTSNILNQQTYGLYLYREWSF